VRQLYDNKHQNDAMDWPIRKEEDYVMRSFWTGNNAWLCEDLHNLGSSAKECRNKRVPIQVPPQDLYKVHWPYIISNDE